MVEVKLTVESPTLSSNIRAPLNRPQGIGHENI